MEDSPENSESDVDDEISPEELQQDFEATMQYIRDSRTPDSCEDSDSEYYNNTTEAERQQEFEATMQYIRDSRTPNSSEDSEQEYLYYSQHTTGGDSQTTPLIDNHPIPCGDSSTNCDNRKRHSSTLHTSEPSCKRPAATSSSQDSKYSPSTSAEPNKSSENVHDNVSIIRKKVAAHWAKFSLDSTTDENDDVKAVLQAGIVVVPTINVTQNKHNRRITKTKQINNYESGTTLNISHAEVVAPGGQIVVNQIMKATVEDDDDEDDSSSDDGNNIYI